MSQDPSLVQHARGSVGTKFASFSKNPLTRTLAMRWKQFATEQAAEQAAEQDRNEHKAGMRVDPAAVQPDEATFVRGAVGSFSGYVVVHI